MFETITDEEYLHSEDYLADAFRVWDCYEQDWIENSPILMRFETRDLLYVSKGIIYQGTVRTELPFEDSVPRGFFPPELMHESCPCWLSDPAFRTHIGDAMTVKELEEEFCQEA